VKTANKAIGETAADFRVERLTRENVAEFAAGLSKMDESVRGRRLGADFWPWLYFGNPAGTGTAAVALAGGRVVGKLGLVPLRVTADRERLTAELGEGLTLLPEWRTWANFRALAAAVAEPERTAAFAFGFATPYISKLHALMGHPVLGRVPIFAGVLNGTGMLAARGFRGPAAVAAGCAARLVFGLKRSDRAAAGIELAEIAGFGDEYDALWRAIEPHRGVAVVKDALYLNWRYVECPAARYHRVAARCGGELAGYIVWRDRGPHGDGYVLELAARGDSRPVLTALLRAAIEGMAGNDTGLAMASFRTSSTCAAVVRSAGFGTWATRLKNMRLIVAPREGESRPERMAGAWHHTLGDWIYH
jgi:hypothetical protein